MHLTNSFPIKGLTMYLYNSLGANKSLDLLPIPVKSVDIITQFKVRLGVPCSGKEDLHYKE